VTLRLLATILFALTFVTEKILLWGRKQKSERDEDKSSLDVFDISGVLSVPLGILLGFTDTGRIHKTSLLISPVGIVLLLLVLKNQRYYRPLVRSMKNILRGSND